MNLTLRVYGTPAPQGSKRHLGRGVMVESSQRVKPWREAVKAAALDALPDDWVPLDGPVSVIATFTWRRPAGHYRTGRNAALLRTLAPLYPTSRTANGDIEKVVRATNDALTDAGVWRDDAQVVLLHADKVWTTGDELPGAYLYIAPIGRDQ